MGFFNKLFCPHYFELVRNIREVEEKYYELLFAVGIKFPNETRHETALRYIRQAKKDR